MIGITESFFLAVAETKNFSQAAEKLFVTQPAVSKHILMLEKELGFLLFERTTRTVRLTPQGKIIYDVLKNSRYAWEEAITAARSIKSDLQGYLRIGMLYGWSVHRLNIPGLKNFQRKYPGVEVAIEKYTYCEMTKKLLNKSLDVIFTIATEVESEPNIQYCHALTNSLILLLSAILPV
jgi:DNA-binding transcriptional LysR family regulator